MKKFTNARVYRRHNEASEILVDRGVIKRIAKSLPEADEEIDLGGRLVVPPYVDPHLHLDYVYTGCSEGATNSSGSPYRSHPSSPRRGRSWPPNARTGPST